MTKKSEMLKIDFDSFISVSESIVDSDSGCQEALKKFNNTLESLKDKNLTKKAAIEIDNAVCGIETEVREAVYKAAFQSGMRFILNTLSGREVIEL